MSDGKCARCGREGYFPYINPYGKGSICYECFGFTVCPKCGSSGIEFVKKLRGNNIYLCGCGNAFVLKPPNHRLVVGCFNCKFYDFGYCSKYETSTSEKMVCDFYWKK